jgi:hypothetical protein
MNILFDRYGAQVEAHLQTPDRLTALLSTIADSGWESSIAAGDLSPGILAGCDVLVLTTRFSQGFDAAELDAIIEFVHGGGGLWCMANHAAPSDDRQTDNYIRYSSSIASTFFASFEASAYMATTSRTPVPLTGSNLTDHPIVHGQPEWPLVEGGSSAVIETVVTRSFCGVYPNDFSRSIVLMQNLDNVVNGQTGHPVSAGVEWALSLEGDRVTGDGRVVICADSGWLGNTESTWPGAGTFQLGDNPQFALNTLSWLTA